jgi:hypothetical protein
MNKNFLFQLAGMLILISINQNDVLQTIILCCYTVPIQQSFIKSDGRPNLSSNEGHLYNQVIF